MKPDWKHLMRKVAIVAPWLFIGALFIGLVYWEWFNYLTTYEGLVALFGVPSWVKILAVTVVLTDVAALGRVVTPESGVDEPRIVQVLLGIWLAVTALDAFLTWYMATVEMEANLTRIPQAMAEFAWLMPMIVAMISWGVSFGLLYTFGMVLEGAVHGRPKVQKPALTPSHAYSKNTP